MRRQTQPHKIPKKRANLSDRGHGNALAQCASKGMQRGSRRSFVTAQTEGHERSNELGASIRGLNQVSIEKRGVRRGAPQNQIGLSKADQIDDDFDRQDTNKKFLSCLKELPYSCFPTADGLSVPGKESLTPRRVPNLKEQFFKQVASLNNDRENNRSKCQEDDRAAWFDQMVGARCRKK